MRIALFSTRSYDRADFTAAATAAGHSVEFHSERLGPATAQLAAGCGAVCAFVNDRLDASTLTVLAELGVRTVALRSAGFNHVDLAAAARLGVAVARVPAYSPHAVAEHAVALILTLDRKTHRAFNRVREGNFALDGLVGFDLRGKTVGIVGTGRIGGALAGILAGFGCTLLGSDPVQDPALVRLGLRYVPLAQLLAAADIVSLHCPLTAATRHLIDAEAIARMKPGAMLINTGRGALIDTRAVIDGLKSGRIGQLGMDVYEEEERLFFEDHSGEVPVDEVFARLLTFPNVLVTAHQGFLTREALHEIAVTTIANIDAIARTGTCPNLVRA